MLETFGVLWHILRLDGPSGLATGGPLSFQGPTAVWRRFLDRIPGRARDRDRTFGMREGLLSNQGLVSLRSSVRSVAPAGTDAPVHSPDPSDPRQGISLGEPDSVTGPADDLADRANPLIQS